MIWIIGFFVRYLFLLPTRIFICFLAVSNFYNIFLKKFNWNKIHFNFKVIWLTLCTGLVGCLSEGPLKRSCYEKVIRHVFLVP